MRNNVKLQAFLDRVLGDNSKQVNIAIIDSDIESYRYYWLENKLNIQASSISAATLGLYDYLKEYCNINLSWCGNHAIGDVKFIVFEGIVSKMIEQKHRAYLNYCTYGYSMSWWDWSRWEQELDFLALNGINLILQVVGLEAVWYKALLELGVSQDKALGYISAPTHWPWQMMTNIEGAMPAISEDYINSRYDLGLKIITRMLELGMTPIQAGFSGCVPRCLEEIYPNEKFYKKADWCGFKGTYELSPDSKLFEEIARIFYKTQGDLFGYHHYYACDPFHENEPPVKSEQYLIMVSKSIQKSMQDMDSEYIWCMQSWSIRKSIATAVPKNKLLILDLAGTKHSTTNNFWGYNFVTGNLHNFGGRINMHGDIKLLARNQFHEIKSKCSNVIGTGLFMEGIEQNPLYYDLALSMLTESTPINLESYLNKYSIRRYGIMNEKLTNALKLLSETVYKENTNGVELSSMVCARPAINVKKSGPNEGFRIPYDNNKLIEAARLMRSVDNNSLKDGYHFDIYDITRQLISNELQSLQKVWQKAYCKNKKAEFHAAKKVFLNKLAELDSLLLTRSEYNFDNKLASMMSLGTNDKDKQYLGSCLKTLVTIWGGDNIDIFDYSWREWGGLIADFYAVRWKMYLDFLGHELDSSIFTRYSRAKERKLPKSHGREAFQANDIYRKIAKFELDWCSR